MSEDTKACPFCGEQILAAASSANTVAATSTPTPAAVPPTQNKPASGFQAIARDKSPSLRSKLLWALLICSVICYFIS